MFPAGNPCRHDMLEPAQAHGRNQWFKKCYPIHYELFFPRGIVDEVEDFDGVQRYLYPSYAVVIKNARGTVSSVEGNRWTAPIVAPLTQNDPSCAIPEPNSFIGLCSIKTTP